jgi:hypothetical protein
VPLQLLSTWRNADMLAVRLRMPSVLYYHLLYILAMVTALCLREVRGCRVAWEGLRAGGRRKMVMIAHCRARSRRNRLVYPVYGTSSGVRPSVRQILQAVGMSFPCAFSMFMGVLSSTAPLIIVVFRLGELIVVFNPELRAT